LIPFISEISNKKVNDWLNLSQEKHGSKRNVREQTMPIIHDRRWKNEIHVYFESYFEDS
jgi:hypothetical protein